MIINIAIVLRAIIVHAFFCAEPSDFHKKENVLEANTTNNTPSTRYIAIFIKG